MGGTQLPHSTTVQQEGTFPEDGRGDTVLRVLLPARDLLTVSCSG